MKKLFAFIFMMICVMLMSIGITSCRQNYDNTDSWFTPEDSAEIAKIAIAAVNFSEVDFASPEQFITHIKALERERSMIDQISQLTPETIGAICNVLQRNNSAIMLDNVFREYQLNKNIYNSISTVTKDRTDEIHNKIEDTDTVHRATAEEEIIAELQHYNKWKGGTANE